MSNLPTVIVSEKDKQEMARWANIMNGGANVPAQPQQRQRVTESYEAPTITTGFTDSDVRSMAEILERLNAVANETTTELVRESKSDPTVRRAIMTEEIDDGIRIGNWEIKVRLDESVSKTKYYSVVQAGSKVVLAKDLVLFEAADLLVKYFNKGKSLTDDEVRTVLHLEEQFSKNWLDAVRYKKKAAKYARERDHNAADIFEARYDSARSNAIKAKTELKEINSRVY